MTQGIAAMKGRDGNPHSQLRGDWHILIISTESTEGLDRKLTTNYYSRFRFTTQLLPLLQAASPELSRVVSVLAPGEESSNFDLDNLDLKNNFSMKNAATHAVCMSDFAFEEAAKRYPKTAFVHAYPGAVKTGFMKETGALTRIGAKVAFALLSPWTVDITESGERHLYAATSGKYPARENDGGVEVAGERVMESSDGRVGNGAYFVGSDGERRIKESVVRELREKGAGEKVWQHTMKMFESVRGSPSSV